MLTPVIEELLRTNVIFSSNLTRVPFTILRLLILHQFDFWDYKENIKD